REAPAGGRLAHAGGAARGARRSQAAAGRAPGRRRSRRERRRGAPRPGRRRGEGPARRVGRGTGRRLSQTPRVRSVKPGWYVLAAVTLYAAVVSVLLFSRPAPDRGAAAPPEAPVSAPPERGAAGANGPEGLWFPIPGARLPRSDANLPGAPRAYRAGVSQGFDFVDGDLDLPVPYGAAVIAAAAGEV